MAKLAVKFGWPDAAIIISALAFVGYFVLFLPTLPQDMKSIALAVPFMMGIGLLITIAGITASVVAIASIVRDSVSNHPVNVWRLFLGIIGVAVFGFSAFVLMLITASFMIGTSQL